MMLTRAEIEERLRINRHYEDVSALETAQQLYERLAQAEKVVEAARERYSLDFDKPVTNAIWQWLHNLDAALAEWEGKDAQR